MTLHLGAAIAHIASIRTELAQHTGCPEWDAPGIRAALIATKGAPSDVSAAACLAAGDPTLRLPSPAGFVAHWPKNAKDAPPVSHNVPCVDHPEHDMPCTHADHGGTFDPAEGLAIVRAALAAARGEQ